MGTHKALINSLPYEACRKFCQGNLYSQTDRFTIVMNQVPETRKILRGLARESTKNYYLRQGVDRYGPNPLSANYSFRAWVNAKPDSRHEANCLLPDSSEETKEPAESALNG